LDVRHRRGIVTLTIPDLAKRLGITDEHRITGVHFEFVQQRLCLLVEGPELPHNYDGDVLMVVPLETVTERT
jgi:hypothetical protein